MDTFDLSFISGHLSSPITRDEQQFILNNDTFYCHKHKILKNYTVELNITKDIYDNCHAYECLIDYIVSYSEKQNKDSLPLDYHKLLDICFQSLELHIINYINPKTQFDIDKIHTQLKEKKKKLVNNHYNELLKWYKIKLTIEHLKDVMCYKNVVYGSMNRITDKLLIEKDTFFFNCPNHGSTLGPTNLLLCVMDILQSRHDLLMYWMMSDIDNKYNNLSLYETGEKIISYFTEVRKRMGNDFYSFIALWEPMVVGYTVSDKIDDLGFDQLYLEMRKEMLSFLNTEDLKQYRNFETILPKTRSIEEICMFNELTGISKIFGHPWIDPIVSFNKIKEHSMEFHYIENSLLMKIKGVFIREFCQNYFFIHKSWPNAELIPHDILREKFRRNLKVSRSDGITIDDWSKIVLGKTLEFNYCADTTELLKDTAIAAPLSKWTSAYDHCAFKINHNQDKPRISSSKSEKRVIMRYLTGNEEEAREKIMEIQQGYWDTEDSIAVLCRKERELKPEGRVFVKQTYRQRLYQVLIEKNIAETLMKYFHGSTMTDSELELLRKQMSVIFEPGCNREIINLDLSKWNLRFRHPLVSCIGKVIDQIYGLKNVYEYNHLWFHSMKVLCNSRFFPPKINKQTGEPLPGESCYHGHRGGLEGMRQKLWTLINEMVIRYVGDTLNLRLNIMCQGDNQVVILKYSPSQIPIKDQLREEFMVQLKSTLERVGLILKPSETWYSRCFFEYGKIRFYKGVGISSATKKISRLIPDINDGIRSFNSCLSTINTVTESAAKVDNYPDNLFLINQFEILNFLLRRKCIDISKQSIDSILSYLFFPSDFGGISLSHYFQHNIRGHDDKVSLWINTFMTLKNYKIPVFKLVLKMCQFSPNKICNYERLIEDIFALNIDSLPSVERVFKDYAHTFLSSEKVTNPEIRKLYNMNESQSKQELCSLLIQMQPLFLPLAHEIVRHSNAGITIALQNKLHNVSTINQIIQDYSDCNFLSLSKLNDEEVSLILRSRQNYREDELGIYIFSRFKCPTQISEFLRKIHWRLDMLGSTRPICLHQFTLKNMDDCTYEEKQKSIMITVSDDFRYSKSGFLYKPGPFRVYFGSITNEKIQKPSMEVMNQTNYIKSVKQLHLIRTWLQRLGSLNLIKLIDKLIDEKIPVIPEELTDIPMQEWCISSSGGNLLHRFKSVIENNQAMINFLPTLGGHFKFSTNYLQFISRGGRDWTIHFQIAFIYSQTLLLHEKNHNFKIHPQYGLVLDCGECTKEVTDISFDLQICPVFNSSEGIEYKSKVQIHYKKSSLSTSDIKKLMSISIGREIGQSFDRYYRNTYDAIQTLDEDNPVFSKINVSINDFKFADFDFTLIGIIQGSNNLKTLLLNNKENLINIVNRSFVALAQLLLNSGRLQEFLQKYNGVATKHSQLINPHSVSEIIFESIIYFLNTQKIEYYLNIFHYLFSEDSQRYIYQLIGWIGKMTELKDKYNSTIDLKKLKTICYMQGYQSKNSILNKLQKVIKFSTLPKVYNVPINDLYILWRSKSITYHNSESLSPVSTSNILSILESDFPRIDISMYIGHYINYNTTGKIYIKELHHLGRPLQNISSAFNKYLEIIVFLELRRTDINSFICLAEGSGGCFLGLLEYFYNSKGYYNTLLTPSVDLREGADQNLPPAVINSSQSLKSRMFKNQTLNIGYTDIIEPSFQVKLLTILNFEKIDLITMDAETSDGSNNFVIVKSLIKTINLCLNKPTILIFKTFIDTYMACDTLENLCSTLIDYDYFFIKCITSHPLNNEIFIIFYYKCTNAILDYQNIKEKALLLTNSLDNMMAVPKQSGFTFCQYMSYSDTLTKISTIFNRFYNSRNMNELRGKTTLGKTRNSIGACSNRCVKILELYELKFSQMLSLLTIENEELKNLMTRHSSTIEELIQDYHTILAFHLLIATDPTILILFLSSITLNFKFDLDHKYDLVNVEINNATHETSLDIPTTFLDNWNLTKDFLKGCSSECYCDHNCLLSSFDIFTQNVAFCKDLIFRFNPEFPARI